MLANVSFVKSTFHGIPQAASVNVPSFVNLMVVAPSLANPLEPRYRPNSDRHLHCRHYPPPLRRHLHPARHPLQSSVRWRSPE